MMYCLLLASVSDPGWQKVRYGKSTLQNEYIEDRKPTMLDIAAFVLFFSRSSVYSSHKSHFSTVQERASLHLLLKLGFRNGYCSD